MNRRRALSQLSTCLRGQVPSNADWTAILSMANDALITSELYPLLATSKQELPEEVRTFLAEVYRRNLKRNVSLFGTLKDALAALNAVGIEPVLLKGCATWCACDGAILEPNGDRMVLDLDLLVLPSEGRRARDALMRSGFLLLEDHETDEDHAIAVLGREQDAGSIDLHDRPPCPVGIAEVDNLHAHCQPVSVGDFRAKLPRSELQILVTSLHDQIIDGDFWMGNFHLRHLIDIAKLTRAAARIDWSFLATACPTPFLLDVVEIQLAAATRIAAAETPNHVGSRMWIKAQYFRIRLQYTDPMINVPLRWLGRIVRWRHLPSRTRVVGVRTSA
ncbi:nucleotidyltransferase family protein [Terricaulis silvestris]|uniref:Nucleotidyltransferase n=1 Tax=Terricaulis silvestris TaxID=2686094 RepID=A0A6I6ML74_9CAUL|nr:nucleotidyltransferase family protein [Terricaulis silvestris]QGZ93407.1 hypothetical protein DSM104635_00217 [Terricaulis silvestris]